MAVYGITDSGFVKETLAEIKDDFEETFKAAFGNGCNFRPGSVMATVIGIASDREAKVWDVAETAWNSRARSTAEGVSLDNDAELTGSVRLKALQSTVATLLLFGDVGTVVDTAKIFSVESNSLALFSPVANSLPLIAGVDEVQLISFSAVPTSGAWAIGIGALTTGSLIYSANAAAVQAAIRQLDGFEDVLVTGNYTAGFTLTFTLGSGKQPLALVTEAANTLLITATPVTTLITETTLGVAQGSVKLKAIAYGPTVALAGSITVINTPLTGLNRVVNVLDAVVGRFVETDAEFRIRVDAELTNPGKTTVEAIRTDLKGITDVLDAVVISNSTMVNDGDGNPPKSIHAYVDGGDEQEIADQLWLSTAGGIETYGDIVKTVIDSQGLSQTIKFSRPVPKNIYLTVTVVKDPATWPIDGVDEIKAVADAFGAALRTGDDVLVYPKLLPYIADRVAGMTNIGIKVGLSATPTLDSNIAVARNERAYFDSTRIVVNVS